MIFHEVYGSYYAAVGRLIAAALSHPLSERDAAQLIGQSAFSESFLHIAEAVKSGQWPVLYARDSCWETPLTRRPLRPMTLLERRWLAAVAEDIRMRLFCSDGELAQLRRMVAGVPPLYAAGDFAVVDRVEQADDYEAPQYQQHFRTIMTAQGPPVLRPVCAHPDGIFRKGRSVSPAGLEEPAALDHQCGADIGVFAVFFGILRIGD